MQNSALRLKFNRYNGHSPLVVHSLLASLRVNKCVGIE